MPDTALPQAAATTTPINPGVRIGHVHLKVSNLDRALRFWRDALGFEVQQQRPQAAFLSAGGYHHHIGLNTWDSEGGPPAPRHAAGLYHVALVYPDRKALANALKRLLQHGAQITGASHHGVSDALYLNDPDGNGVELYIDLPEEVWPRTPDGQLNMSTRRLDVMALLAEAD